jgi:transcriptional regulator with XRE-family HTH domain
MEEHLKTFIRESGESLNQLGKRSGVGADQLSRFMRGKRTLTLPVVSRLFEALNLRVVRVEQGQREGPGLASPPKTPQE